jgi:site-specific recombinase XerD
MDTAEKDIALPFPESLVDVLEAWREHGMAAGHSGRTIEARVGTVQRLARDVDPVHASRAELTGWLSSRTLPDGAPVQRSTQATYRAQLRAFYDWMADTGRREDDPSARLPTPKAPRGIPHPLTPAQVAAVLDACADPRAEQTRAYVMLAAFAGFRAHEIAKVRGEDFVGDEIYVVGKGGVSSTVPMVPVIRRLADRMPASGYWFGSDSASGHVHRCSVSTAIQRAFRRAGLHAVPHALRHHYCTQVLRASGGDLRTTQRAARHASPATTAIYTQVADETLMRAVFGIPGAA